MDRFPWLEIFFHQCIESQGRPKKKGWLTGMLKLTTRYIAVRPLSELDLTSNPACTYYYAVPDAQVGVEKAIDLTAFCITSPGVSFRLSERSGAQTVNEGDVSTHDQLVYSVNTTFCYGFFPNTRKEYCFEYLPSTHSVRDGVTTLCERYGHVHARKVDKEKVFFDSLEPTAIVVSRLISLRSLGDILCTFDIYDTSNIPMTRFCTAKHRR